MRYLYNMEIGLRVGLLYESDFCTSRTLFRVGLFSEFESNSEFGQYTLAQFFRKFRQNCDKVENKQSKTVISCQISCHNSAKFWPIGVKYFMVTQETIINRLVIKDPGFGILLPLSIFLVPKKGRGPTDTHMGLGPRNPTKKLTHLVKLLGHLLSRKLFGPWIPPP